jgi:hypothetical protein
MDLQLYMSRGVRQLILETHDFYIEQVKARVLGQFRDIGDEADRFANAEYGRLGSLPGDGTTGLDEIAEAALDRARDFYTLLSDLRKQMLLGALAGLYHQWDKDLRGFIERELRHDIDRHLAEQFWSRNLGSVFDLLAEFGWDCRSAAFGPKIEACGLIVNVYKHGKGRSLDDLVVRFPEYLDDGFTAPPMASGFVDHEWLSISEEQFEELAQALRLFWEAFPERLFLKPPNPVAEPRAP